MNTDLAAIFSAIESSANGYPSEKDIKGLFADFDTTSNRLGNTVKDKNTRLAAVIKGVEGLNFGNFEDNQIDLFGDAYEFLISNYAANAGKSGGEFFTPQSVSKLIAKLAIHNQKTINKIYDPAAGSGSLLLQAKKQFDEHIIEDGFFGQEINHTTYNLARMNMFLHNVNYDKFNIALGNALLDPQFGGEKPFDAIVSNPPYSINWIGSDDPTLINDERFAPAGVLAPKSKADFAFVLHALSYLSSKGRAAIVCFPGIFYRGGAEQKIRKYLIDNNYVETVISLAPNLFYGTSIAVNILVLSKHKSDTKTQFIDASGEDFYKKETNNNVLTEEHIEKIIKMFDSKEDTPYISKSIDNDKIAEENYNLSVSTYVEANDEDGLPVFSDEQISFLNYLSGLPPLVRIHEYEIIRLLLDGISDINDISIALEEKISGYDPESLEHALQFMNYITKNGNDLSLDVTIDDQLREYLDDLLEYGITKYTADNGDETGFKLWQNYRMDQVQLKLLKNPGHNQVGTYYYDDYAVIFASLKKDLSQEDKLNYKDKFLQADLFQWESKTNLSGSDLTKLKNSSYAHLFIRKVADENGIVLPFTYVGKGKLSNCRKTENGNGTYLFDIGMKNELPDYLQYDFGLTK